MVIFMTALQLYDICLRLKSGTDGNYWWLMELKKLDPFFRRKRFLAALEDINTKSNEEALMKLLGRIGWDTQQWESPRF